MPIEGTAAGETATFKVRIRRGGESVAESGAMTVALGGGKIPPANLVGLQAVRVSPAARLSIARSGGDATRAAVSWPSEFGGLQLQMTSDLGGGWEPAGGERTTNGVSILAPTSTEGNRKFFSVE